jgi:hypothetical protein
MATIHPSITGKGILDDYDSEEETARQLHIKKRTLQRWRAKRVGPPVTFIGRKPMYYRPSTAQWVRGREKIMIREGKARRRS